jgi:hypothetical protein
MFPYKSFLERHLWISYGLLAISIVGLFFIPWFNRWLKNKEEIYNNNLRLTYKVLILDKILFAKFDRFVEWRLRNSSETDDLIISFRKKWYARWFARLIGKPENPEWNSIDGKNSDSYSFAKNDELYKYETKLDQSVLTYLLKKHFDMTEAQATIVWNGLRNKHEDLKNSNKLSIIETLIDRIVRMSFPPGGCGIGFITSNYHLNLIVCSNFLYRSKEKVMLQCGFDDNEVISNFTSYYLGIEREYISYESKKVLLNKKEGLKNLLLRFGILSEEERGWIIDEVLSIKTAPEVRKTAYLLAQARRTTDDNGLKFLPDEICIKIAALTAEEGVDLETAEQVARNYLRRPKPYLWIN